MLSFIFVLIATATYAVGSLNGRPKIPKIVGITSGCFGLILLIIIGIYAYNRKRQTNATSSGLSSIVNLTTMIDHTHNTSHELKTVQSILNMPNK